MALSSSTVFECNASATAANVNGGGFNPANANMLTDGAATSATGNSPVFSSASYNFVAGDVNHWLYIKSGTNWTAGWYQIASVAANAATLSAAIGQAVQQITSQRVGANTVAGCATTASPSSATWTIDYSQSTASPFASTDIAVVTTTTLTSASHPFGKNMVGNLIHITAGTATAGWYEISSVTGTTATIDRSAVTTGTNNTGKVGGALSLGSSDDAVFELSVSGAAAAARYFIKNGSYTLGGTVSVSKSGGTNWPFIYEGYSSLRGDNPTIANSPTFILGAAAFTISSSYIIRNLNFTGSATTVLSLGSGTFVTVVNCKIVNTSTTAGGYALDASASSDNFFLGCELISYRGYGAQINISAILQGCYIHDSDVGVYCVATDFVLLNNIISDNVTDAIVANNSALTDTTLISGNTLYGAENKLGTGLAISAGQNYAKFINNIIYGFATGVSGGPTSILNFYDYNNYFNNTTDIADVTKWQKGAHDIAVNPSFTTMAQITGTGASSSTNVLTDGAANFSSVTDNVDFVYLSAGTGTGIGLVKYLITSHTTTTLTLSSNITSSGSGSAISYQITTGHNFLPTGAI